MAQNILQTKENLAYLAGIIDGEGTITLRKVQAARNFVPTVSVSNSEPCLIEWLLENWDGSFGSRQLDPKWKTTLTWGCTGHAAVELVESIFPYLLIKRKRAEVLLAFWKLHEDFQIVPKLSPPEYYLLADALWSKMQVLNRRGSEEV